MRLVTTLLAYLLVSVVSGQTLVDSVLLRIINREYQTELVWCQDLNKLAYSMTKEKLLDFPEESPSHNKFLSKGRGLYEITITIKKENSLKSNLVIDCLGTSGKARRIFRKFEREKGLIGIATDSQKVVISDKRGKKKATYHVEITTILIYL